MTLEIEVVPQDDLIDVRRCIVVRGAVPNASVEIECRSVRPDGSEWHASATFRAGQDGVVDVTASAPTAGSYAGISPMGLVWSQVEVHAVDDAKQSGQDWLQPVVNELSASCDGRTATATMVQRQMASGVIRREVLEEGLSGTLFLPQGAGPHPAVMIMNGSGGGINEPRAALYASRGYVALALGYFRAPGRPDYISDTPLEYFRDGLRWLRRTTRPLNDFVAITGQSRGGELVLLLGATFPDEIDAVLAYVPAAYVHSGQSAADPQRGGRNGHVWTLNGKPLPHLMENNRTGTWAPYDAGPEPKRLEYALLTAMADRDAMARSRIPVERIKAPVLLAHGTDDGWWPTDYHCDIVEETLKGVEHPYPVRRLRYQDAGHIIVFPYVPTTRIVEPHAISGILSTNGGTPEANARANEHVWPAVLEFLAEAVDAHASRRSAAHEGLVKVEVDTELGPVLCTIDTIRAPIAAANFLAYVDGGHMAGAEIYRIATLANQVRPDHQIEVIQWGYRMDPGVGPLPRIAHETTGQTSIKHKRGSLSMARRDVGTAGPGFVFCIGGDLSSLDEGGGRHPDGQGFTAFGEVVDGFDVLERIHDTAEQGNEWPASPLRILRARRLHSNCEYHQQ